MRIAITPNFSQYNVSDSFFKISNLVAAVVHVKIEGWNMAGSIKMKPAIKIINELENRNLLRQNGKIIESSSGNFGVALSIIAAERGYQFTCVTDPNASIESIRFMEAVGANIIIVSEHDHNGGFLATRINKIQELCALDPELIWVNQYKNPDGFWSHYETTATEIINRFSSNVDYLFVGAGTTGTLMGCIYYFKKHSPKTKIVAIDAEGSITFGYPSKKRYIPGIGTSRRPEILDESVVNEHLIIPEDETIKMCHMMARSGFLCGGSTGSILAGVVKYANKISSNHTVVIISPDLGYKYLNTIYNNEWLLDRFPDLHVKNEVLYE